MECPDCSKVNWVVVREKVEIQTRFVDLGTGSAGTKKYTKNWRKEETKKERIIGVRCNSCDLMLTDKHLEGREVGIKEIHATKGVLLENQAMNKFLE